MKKPLIHEGKIAKLTRFSCSGSSYILFDIELRGEINANPGQFIMLETGSDSYLDRPFSILRLKGARLSLLIEVKGVGTSKLNSMEPGNAVRFKGIHGKGLGPLENYAGKDTPDGAHFVTQHLSGVAAPSGSVPAGVSHWTSGDLSSKEFVLIAGGMGIVPIFYLCSQLDPHGGGRIKMFFGARSQSFFDALDEHLKFSEALAGLQIYLVPFEESGKTVMDVFLKHVEEKGAPEHVISCGPEGMQKKVQDFIIDMKISGELILERHMACGRGMCMACPVMISDGEAEIIEMACTHGPVFAVGRGRKVIFQ